MNLEQAANLAQVGAALVVVAGLAFAMVQVRELGRQRREAAAIQLAQAFGNREFALAFRQVLDLRPGAGVALVKRQGVEEAAMLVSLIVEYVAIMVDREIIDMVWELTGGVVLSTWDRLRDWSASHRGQGGTEKFNERFKWLAVRLAENCSGPRSEPAFKRFARWRPPPR